MNPYLLALLLGIIEGVTEFLPVSSTAHLRVAQAAFQVDLSDPFWKMFTIVIQLGAVLCLPVYFWGRIVRFGRSFPRGERGDRNLVTHPVALTVIAFVVTAGPVFLLKKVISANLESLLVIGWALVVGGAIMWVVDAVWGARELKVALAKPVTAASGNERAPTAVLGYETPLPGGLTRDVEQMSLLQAVWIGFCQIFSAVFPGTSRSMATIAAGQVAGMSRATALEFSFFLSIPTMFVATGYDLLKAIGPGDSAGGLAPVHVTGHQWVLVAIGFVTSFFVAWGVVAWFMSWVRRRGFVPFAVYRIVLGSAVLVWALVESGAAGR